MSERGLVIMGLLTFLEDIYPESGLSVCSYLIRFPAEWHEGSGMPYPFFPVKETKIVCHDRTCRRLITGLALCLLVLLSACHGGGGSPPEADPVPSTSGRLLAGVARSRLDVPIGIPMGGYGLRQGPRTHFNVIMGGSEGYYDWPTVKVLVLEMDGRRLVIARGSFCFPTESLRARIVAQVLERTGIDLDRSLVLHGNHTHSGPARYIPVPDLLGAVVMDVYHQEVADRIAASCTEVIVEALESTIPARIGFGSLEELDPGEVYAYDRRCHNGPGSYKEDRLTVGRVETDDGRALAVLVGMALHGTLFHSTYLTGDVPDGIERWVEAAYDHPVTAIYLQGAAGDVNPHTGSPFGHGKLQMIDWIGYTVSRQVAQVEKSIETDPAPPMDVVTRRIHFDRDAIGYEAGEFGRRTPGGGFAEFELGAFMCGSVPSALHGSIVDCDDPDTSLVDGHLGCLVDVSWDLCRPYAPYFQQATLTVTRIGDQVFYTMPGEITAHLAYSARERIAEVLGADMARVATIGYANNYLFYLTEAWDWMQGGYETEMSLFGWRFGPFLVDEIVGLAARLDSPAVDPVDTVPALRYVRDDAPFEAEISERLGEVESRPAARVTRFDTVRFSWYGGHPAVDDFRVGLQRLEGGAYVDVPRANGLPYDDAGWEMRLTHRPCPSYEADFRRESRAFLYELEWETSYDDPVGTLRFKGEGRAGTEAGIVRYEIASDPFELGPSMDVGVSGLAAELEGGEIVIIAEAAYPANPLGWRMRSPLGGGSRPAPLIHGMADAIVSVEGEGDMTCALAYDPARSAFVGRMIPLAPGAVHTLTIPVGGLDDGWGNSNNTGAGPVTITP